MDDQKFNEAVVRTENQDFGSIRSRLTWNAHRVADALNTFILAARRLDWEVKKECYYGKPAKFEEPRLFTHLDMTNPSIEVIRYLHCFLGVATEAAEGMEALTEPTLDEVNIREEIGDTLYYLGLGTDQSGSGIGELQEKVIAKLAARYGKAFSADKAANRDLAKEREVLEK